MGIVLRMLKEIAHKSSLLTDGKQKILENSFLKEIFSNLIKGTVFWSFGSTKVYQSNSLQWQH